MVYSMTAFARAQSQQLSQLKGAALSWELKSVNHRFLETQFRLPEQLRGIEHALRESARSRLNRGKVDCTLKIEYPETAETLELNEGLLVEVNALIQRVQQHLPDARPAGALDLLRWPGMVGEGGGLDTAELEIAARQLFDDALQDLIDHRQREGSQLAETIVERLNAIDAIVAEIKAATSTAPQAVKTKLAERLRGLTDHVNADRLEQEVALLAQRADVGEELDRLLIHTREARHHLQDLEASGPHGRRLDFLTQELNREANTLGSKSTTAQTSQNAVDLKVLIEQIREQVQNVE